jgi:hypothetical protein
MSYILISKSHSSRPEFLMKPDFLTPIAGKGCHSQHIITTRIMTLCVHIRLYHCKWGVGQLIEVCLTNLDQLSFFITSSWGQTPRQSASILILYPTPCPKAPVHFLQLSRFTHTEETYDVICIITLHLYFQSLPTIGAISPTIHIIA